MSKIFVGMTKLRFCSFVNLSFLALLYLFSLEFASSANPSFVRVFERTGGANFSMIFRTNNNDNYKEIVKMHSEASFLMNWDNISNSFLARSVKNNFAEQSIVVFLTASFFDEIESAHSVVSSLRRTFSNITGMTLKYVMADTGVRGNLQPYIDAFEEKGLVFLNDYTVLTTELLETDFRGINIIDYDSFGSTVQNNLKKKLRRLRKDHDIKPMNLAFFIERFSRIERFSQSISTSTQQPRTVAPSRLTEPNTSSSSSSSSFSTNQYSRFSSLPSQSASLSTHYGSFAIDSKPSANVTSRTSTSTSHVQGSRRITTCNTAGTFTLLFKGGLQHLDNIKLHDQNCALLLSNEEFLAADDALLRRIHDEGRKFVIHFAQSPENERGARDIKTQIDLKFNRIQAYLEYVMLPESISPQIRNVFVSAPVNEIRSGSRFEDAEGGIEGMGNPFDFRDLILVDLESSESPAKLLRVLETKMERQEVSPMSLDECKRTRYLANPNPSSELTEIQKHDRVRNALRADRPYIQPTVNVYTSRVNIFNDSFNQLRIVTDNELKQGRLRVVFDGEGGIDAGGLAREWYCLLVRQVFNPDYALFSAPETNQNAFHFNPNSVVNENYRSLYQFVGRFIGKSVVDGVPLDCHFSRAFYKLLLNKNLTLYDLEECDPESHRSLSWIAENQIEGVMDELTFSVDVDDFGAHRVVPLKPNGANIQVNDTNKFEYIQLSIKYKLHESIRAQATAFIEAFRRLVPVELFAGFTVSELQRLISGNGEISVDDWEANTRYSGRLNATKPISIWFWQAVRSFTPQEHVSLLRFATGSTSVPVGGFRLLSSNGSPAPFTISSVDLDHTRLPIAHTCFNRIDLPNYINPQNLREKLLLAINEGNGAFAIA